MARETRTPIRLPETLLNAPGRDILAGSNTRRGHILDLGTAQNTLWTSGRTYQQPVVSQSFGDDQMSTDIVALTADANALWFVPPLSPGHTQVRCMVRAEGAGDGVVQWSSVQGGDVQAINVVGALGWYELVLDVDTSGGWDLIELRIGRDAGGGINTRVLDTSVRFQGLSTPLASYDADPDAYGDFRPVDADELTGDDPLTSELAKRLRSNLEALEPRPRTYLSLSAVQGTSAITDAGALGALGPYVHKAWTPVIGGTRTQEYELAWAAVVSSPGGGGDWTFEIQHGRGDIYRFNENRTTVTVPDGSDRDVITGTVRLSETRDLPSGGVPGHYAGFTQLAILPATLNTFNEGVVHTFAAWGR